jgi:hypothetical protein
MFGDKLHALMKGGNVYTAERMIPLYSRDCPLYKSGFRYRVYCNGKPCSFVKTKKEFEAYVGWQPDYPAITAQHKMVEEVVAQSEWEGNQALTKLRERQAKKKEARDGEVQSS